MKTKMITVFTFAVLILGAVGFSPRIARADCEAVSCSTTISRLYINSSVVYIRPAAADAADLDCHLISDVYIQLLPAHPQYKEIYAALLLGYSMNKTMGLRINGGDADCTINYVTLD